ncbi:V-type proton ATPase 116 kDa subunit a1-like [Teleopsis dalmanni]|uniref:V-type proton ATPase 116 kDa subunit a1-like n=1 Tax=Teleopsis dalmanni TaxID=139649 RepID=UPI0018CF64C2|nr:V-type proton ATPase 116 kDa subunit a1-like [Teleopsis dalmanni]
MTTFYRSADMSLCQIVLHKESAFDCMIALGYLGQVEFVSNWRTDNTDAENEYAIGVKRCMDLLKIIERIEEEMDESNIKSVYYPAVDTENVPKASDLLEIEENMEQFESELDGAFGQTHELEKHRNFLNDRLLVIKKADDFMSGAKNEGAILAYSGSIIIQILRDEISDAPTRPPLHLSYVTGTIPIHRFATFEVLMWRMCHGNCLIKHDLLELNEEALSNPRRRRYIFMIFFVGDQLQQKILRTCKGFLIELYEVPETQEDRLRTCHQLKKEINDINEVLESAKNHRLRVLKFAATEIYIWKNQVKKIMLTFAELSKFSTLENLDKYLVRECWIPTMQLGKVRKALMNGAMRAAKRPGVPMFIPMLDIQEFDPDEREPPTHFVLNKYTRGFQNLIDSYGVASYRELNPAPYTMVTFPFLFAVMFGDFGHGMIMALFALTLIVREEKIKAKLDSLINPSEINTILFAGRYVILLMGLFSMYTGLMYNDVFSKSFNIVGSSWRVNFTWDEINESKDISLDPRRKDLYSNNPCYFGMDPVWDASGENDIIVLNSMKMKMAIILGVAQMLFGYTLSALNYRHFKKKADLYLVFIPQFVFLNCLFTYLCFLIILKWFMYGANKDPPNNSACAPSILIIFINMILMKSDKETKEGCDRYMYFGQPVIEILLLLLAYLSIPVLLLGKPLYLVHQKRKLKKIQDEEAKNRKLRDTLTSVRSSLVYTVVQIKKEKEEKVDMSEVWIHSGIACIESILGSVSHTASYLRLWALSLAHDQLSTVLWNMVFAIALKGNFGWLGGIIIFVIFSIWAVLTISILVVMEGLSAFLHTLRLHWVEFQSKFYSGMGVAFSPFGFEKSTLRA